MGEMASQITSLASVYSTVYSGADQRIHQSSVSLAFVRRIHRWPVNSPHQGPVTRKVFPFWWRHHKLCMIWLKKRLVPNYNKPKIARTICIMFWLYCTLCNNNTTHTDHYAQQLTFQQRYKSATNKIWGNPFILKLISLPLNHNNLFVCQEILFVNPCSVLHGYKSWFFQSDQTRHGNSKATRKLNIMLSGLSFG